MENFKSSPTVPQEKGCATIAAFAVVAVPVTFIPIIGLFLGPAILYAGWQMAKNGRVGPCPYCGSQVSLTGDKEVRHQKCRECKHNLSLRDEVLYDLDSPIEPAPAAPAETSAKAAA